VLRVAADLSAPGVGDGLIRLERSQPDTVPSATALTAIAAGGDWRSADSAAATVRTAELSRMAGTVLRPQPLNPAEPAVTPTLTTTPTSTLTPRAAVSNPAGATRAAAPAAPAADTPTAGEKAATTPSGKRRKASPAASTSEATGKAGGNRK